VGARGGRAPAVAHTRRRRSHCFACARQHLTHGRAAAAASAALTTTTTCLSLRARSCGLMHSSPTVRGHALSLHRRLSAFDSTRPAVAAMNDLFAMSYMRHE
jgi:hypothetical protein